MAGNELVPERRTNKNGVTSTKWVKPAEKPVIQRWTPPPMRSTMAAITDRKATIKDLTDKMHDTVYGRDNFDFESLRDIQETLSKYPDEALRQIRGFFYDHSSGFRYHGGEHHVLASMVESGANSETATDLMKYSKDYAHDAIVAYSYYRQRGWIDWDLEGKEDPRLEALESVAGNIEKVRQSGRPVARKAGGADTLWDIPIIKDERVFRLALERLDDNDRIIEIIKEGKTDYDLIVTELDASVKALSKGHL